MSFFELLTIKSVEHNVRRNNEIIRLSLKSTLNFSKNSKIAKKL